MDVVAWDNTSPQNAKQILVLFDNEKLSFEDVYWLKQYATTEMEQETIQWLQQLATNYMKVKKRQELVLKAPRIEALIVACHEEFIRQQTAAQKDISNDQESKTIDLKTDQMRTMQECVISLLRRMFENAPEFTRESQLIRQAPRVLNTQMKKNAAKMIRTRNEEPTVPLKKKRGIQVNIVDDGRIKSVGIQDHNTRGTQVDNNEINMNEGCRDDQSIERGTVAISSRDNIGESSKTQAINMHKVPRRFAGVKRQAPCSALSEIDEYLGFSLELLHQSDTVRVKNQKIKPE